jgi:phosphoadenosine phosphosulfate reductase
MIEQMLPGYDASARDLARQAIAMPLADKVAIAIATLQTWAEHAESLNPAGYWLAFSGGKDSQVIYDLAERAGVPFVARYGVTSLDPPELVRFIRAQYPTVGFVRQPKALLNRLVDRSNGPPTRMARWCCEEYKEQGGKGYAKIIGVRAAESPNRAAMWRVVVPHRTNGLIVCPILYWTDADVWGYHRERGLPHCCLYDQGFKRLGCIGCPMGGSKGVKREFARWPRYAAWWERSVKEHWERCHTLTNSRNGEPLYTASFPTAEAYWQWWLSGTRRREDECQYGSLFS